MNGRDLASATIAVHQVLAPIPDSDIEAALAPARIGAGTKVVRLGGKGVAFDELHEFDWGSAHDALLRDIETLLDPALSGAVGPIHYFGMLPIPLAIELGSRIGPTRRILPYQQRHDSKSWRWPEEVSTVEATLDGIPNAASHAKGDVILTVACSHPVDVRDARVIVPDALGELRLSVSKPHEDVLRSEMDVIRVATKFGEALDAIRRFYPDCGTVHVFAAVPPALAVRLGTELNPTIHRPLQTYQFSDRSSPRYTRAIVVGERPRRTLSEAEREVAAKTRAVFSQALEEIRALPDSTNSNSIGWLSTLFGPDAGFLPNGVWVLGPLGNGNRTIFGSHVSDAKDAAGEFRWDSDNQAWVFDDRLLSALAARLSGPQLVQAARLFLLHEAVHVARQGLTTATAERVGRLPRILEEVDYLADVWALIHECARARRAGETNDADTASFFRRMLRVVTATFWAFDAADLPLRAVQVRRLNRYLLWYWQRIRLESANTPNDVLRILSAKPVLEVSGSRISVSRNRVMLELDPAYFEELEFGVLGDGFRMVRIGSRPGASVANLLNALRGGKEEAFLSALRGLFDSIAQTSLSDLDADAPHGGGS